jgi:CBS domain-containing protein
MPSSKAARLPVVEIMSRDPITIDPHATVSAAAAVMRDRGVGSLVVVDAGKAVGIITERDLVTKVAAEDRKASAVKVKDIMTSPLISVHPHEEVEEAAKRMSKRRIRRLPVVQDGKLLGVITENDILRVWPHLVEVTREWARAGMLDEGPGPVEGHCDSCGIYSTQLMRDGKLLLGPECRDR